MRDDTAEGAERRATKPRIRKALLQGWWKVSYFYPSRREWFCKTRQARKRGQGENTLNDAARLIAAGDAVVGLLVKGHAGN
jgi:hypothetical protein